MKATGIVRRIDDLGRVVVPKEIRRTLRIREGDPLEIFTDNEGSIILRKYSPIGEMTPFAKQYAEALSSVAGHMIIITDRDQAIATAGGVKGDVLGKHISKTLETIMDERQAFNTANGKLPINILEGTDFTEYQQVIYPIICEGDVIGSVVIMSKTNSKLTETESKLAGVAALFLARQMEN
ncbi:MAG: stage V sporulation protein T [Lachnospiraceae bacterium]|nr:stage V sporulation protein T [Lachnospiraceae bacterium]